MSKKKIWSITIASVAALSITGSALAAQSAGSSGGSYYPAGAGTSAAASAAQVSGERVGQAKAPEERNKTRITRQQAEKIAVQAVQGKVVEVDLDKDDGVLIYEIELKTAYGKAEVDIAAYGGKVLLIDKDRYDGDDDHWDDDYYDRDDRDDDGDDD